MLIDDGYILMIPGFLDDISDRVVLYAVDSILALRSAPRQLIGHPAEDLPRDDWGTVTVSADKVRRWIVGERLVKVKLNPSGSIRVTYSEAREWRRWVSEDDWAWVTAVCECSAVHTAQVEAQQEAAARPRMGAKIAILADFSAGDEQRGANGARRVRVSKKMRKAAAKMRRQQRHENYD